MTSKTEKYEFQAETKRLLDIVIHSLYTDKEIFLRELISNASDALDRLRFEALTKPELIEEGAQLEIRLNPDKEERTLTIQDNGVGMSRKEVIQNLGTIAKSGTQEVFERIKKAKSEQDVGQLIGQFGVGFYSAFMVADQVEVVTRRSGQKRATRWVSQGDGSFTVEDAARESAGTTIRLHLKPVEPEHGLEDFTDGWRLTQLVKRYSDFVTYPIILKDIREESLTDESGKPVAGGKKEIVHEEKTLNSMKPLWKRPPDEVSQDDYFEFFKHLSYDWEKPLKTLSLKAEGMHEYQALLFIPAKAPHDLYFHATDYGLQLYAGRVNVMERCQELLPRYLRFIKGVVDSADLPLNISRQRLQNDRHIAQIRQWLTKKVLEALADLKKSDSELYLTIWKEFGTCLKEALGTDWKNKDKMLELLLLQSSNHPEKLTSLQDYFERMQEGQEEIYYLTGESRSRIENSPQLEKFKEKGYEVLYLVEAVDELMMQSLSEYEGRRFKSAGKGEVDFEESKDDAKAGEREQQEKEFSSLSEFLQKCLEDEIKQVRLSKRLTTSPVCLVGTEMDNSPHFERLMKRANIAGPRQRRILELNPGHPIIQTLKSRFEADQEDPVLKDYAQLLFGYGLLAEGSDLPDPSRFGSLVASLMEFQLTGSGSAPTQGPATGNGDQTGQGEAQSA